MTTEYIISLQEKLKTILNFITALIYICIVCFGCVINNVVKNMKKYSDVLNSKSRSEWEALIKEWVHNEVDRKMLSRYLLDGIHLEMLAEEFDLSTVQCQKRVDLSRKQLFLHI